MSPPKPRRISRLLPDVLRHMLEAVEHAQSYVAGLTVETFTADSKSIHAVERCLEIISEASRDIPPDVKLQHPNTPWK